jgi:2-polyprenyl-6-methoxyphenol hydroxylase-like FAD-dependent oxidoreductase
MTGSPRYDVCIVGAGLIGLAVAAALVESHPGISLLILERRIGVYLVATTTAWSLRPLLPPRVAPRPGSVPRAG